MPEVLQGIEYYERAIAADPSYALPYAGVAEAMRALVLSNDAPPAEMAPRAVAAANRAIELAPDLPETNYARGLVALWLEWDWRATETYLSRAVELAPNNADAHIFLAHLYSNLGPQAGGADARANARRAESGQPDDRLRSKACSSRNSASTRRGAAPSQEASRLDPEFWLSHHLLANALIDAGQYEAALKESAEAKRLSPLQTLSDTFGAIALARLGRTNEARAVLDVAGRNCASYLCPALAFRDDRSGTRRIATRRSTDLDAALSVSRCAPGAAEGRSKVG